MAYCKYERTSHRTAKSLFLFEQGVTNRLAKHDTLTSAFKSWNTHSASSPRANQSSQSMAAANVFVAMIRNQHALTLKKIQAQT
jgi:hypothetical protein